MAKIIDFNNNWDLTHIDDKTKLILLLHNSKFTETLKILLENNINLNIIFEDENICNVYINNSFKKINNNLMCSKIMEKLLKTLYEFFSNITEINVLDINIIPIQNELITLRKKYDTYLNDKDIQPKVNCLIKNIFDKKKDTTKLLFDEIAILHNKPSKA